MTNKRKSIETLLKLYLIGHIRQKQIRSTLAMARISQISFK